MRRTFYNPRIARLGLLISLTLVLSALAAALPPKITSQPVSQTITAGKTATFSVTASGTAPLTYQWQKNGTPITGATSASYTTPATLGSDTGEQFAVVVRNVVGTVTSNTAVLTVNIPPSITTQPMSEAVTAGQTATFSVLAAGATPLSYQWKQNGKSITGGTAASYTTPATLGSDTGEQFAVVVSNSVGTATSSTAVLTVNIPPSITTQPMSEAVTAGQTATFSVLAAGATPLSYQWKKNGKSIIGGTAASYTTPPTSTSENGAQFMVVVSNSVGTVTSYTAVLTVSAPGAPSIIAQPMSQTVIVGQMAIFSVAASGTAPLTYQWRENGVPIPGATSSSYIIPSTATSDNGPLFEVTVSNSAGTAISNNAILFVTVPGPLSASTASVNFANVSVGSNSYIDVRFSNSGTANLTFLGIVMTGPGFSCSGIPTGQILAPGQTAIMTVNFSPAAAGDVVGSINITSDAINSSTVIALSGSGVQSVSPAIDVTWTASTSDVVGYNIYESAVSGGPYLLLNHSVISAVDYLDPSVLAGQSYYYVVTAVDVNGVESAYSNEAQAAVPAP